MPDSNDKNSLPVFGGIRKILDDMAINRKRISRLCEEMENAEYWEDDDTLISDVEYFLLGG